MVLWPAGVLALRSISTIISLDLGGLVSNSGFKEWLSSFGLRLAWGWSSKIVCQTYEPWKLVSDISYDESASCGIKVAPGAISRENLGEFLWWETAENWRNLHLSFCSWCSVVFGLELWISIWISNHAAKKRAGLVVYKPVVIHTLNPAEHFGGAPQWQVVLFLTGFPTRKIRRWFDITKIGILFIWGSNGFSASEF